MELYSDLPEDFDYEIDDAPESVDLASAKQTYLRHHQATQQHLKKLKDQRKSKNKEKNELLHQRSLKRKASKPYKSAGDENLLESEGSDNKNEEPTDELPIDVLKTLELIEGSHHQSKETFTPKDPKVVVLHSNPTRLHTKDEFSPIIENNLVNRRKTEISKTNSMGRSTSLQYQLVSTSNFKETPPLSTSAKAFLGRQLCKSDQRIPMTKAISLYHYGPPPNFLEKSKIKTKLGVPLEFKPKVKKIRKKHDWEDILV
ncbi:hypothetical protein HMI54_001587 [Coelomomyces lativittatus]|nr:hypothetical protein HMI55_003137 [Coelomomyces lativittatus]KAJ1506315.1 hypothetical protein HMI56_000668 [Coelomomyces lativittatus]KAJ1510467.1 hypothetical protein HMI54_001587 [Coelomomyces lativittatus]